ncbi:MAG: signal peptidase II [Planctomycetota bacterium]
MTTTTRDRAGGSPVAWAVLLITIVLGVVFDLATKHLAFEHLADQPVHIHRDAVLARKATGLDLNIRGPIPPIVESRPIPPLAQTELIPVHNSTVLVPYGLELTLVLNPGAVFGIGAGKRWVFVAFTVIAAAVAITVFARSVHRHDLATQIALGLVIAGGVGNLYDRLVYACVRDFLHPLAGVNMPFGLPGPGGGTAVWPYVSNVADALLLIGIGVLLIRLWRSGGEPREAKGPDTGPDDPAPARAGGQPPAV